VEDEALAVQMLLPGLQTYSRFGFMG